MCVSETSWSRCDDIHSGRSDEPPLLCETKAYMLQVSVVVPSRNRVALLKRTLRSALSQQDVELEVVVVGVLVEFRVLEDLGDDG